jgi:alkyl hydroperoxide reductase subunit AhpC
MASQCYVLIIHTIFHSVYSSQFPDLFGETQDSDYFSLYEYLGSKAWGIVFMHPGDFTPVCTTELGAAQSLKAEFDARNTKLCGFSCDDATSHRAWVADIEAATGQRIDFPLFCDPTRMHSIELGVFDPKLKDKAGLPRTVRSVFILNPKKEIELTMTYPSTVGRNFDEILRVLDALQRASNFGVVTPANWQPGDRTIVSYDMDDRKADEKFGKVNAFSPSSRFVSHLVSFASLLTP